MWGRFFVGVGGTEFHRPDRERGKLLTFRKVAYEPLPHREALHYPRREMPRVGRLIIQDILDREPRIRLRLRPRESIESVPATHNKYALAYLRNAELVRREVPVVDGIVR